MRIFISYRREDSAGHTGRLYDSLQAHFGRENVFMDRSGIDSGQNFVDAIDTAVRSCDALVAVIGKEWLTCVGAGGRRLDDPGDFVRAEIAAALERGITVIPVLVEGTTMPSAAALPDALKPLAKRHAHELSDARWSYDVGRLIEATEKLSGKPRGWERRTRFASAAALALVAILGTMFFIRTLREPDPALLDPDAYASRATGLTEDGTAPQSVGLAGDWSAEVTYERGAKHTERFTFKLDGNEVLGTASFLGSRRGIAGGTLNGNSVLFQTRTQEALGDWNNPKDVVHRYRGRISGDTITFYMQSEGGSSSLPVEFTARRVSEAATPPGGKRP